jgi:hypothetical protein
MSHNWGKTQMLLTFSILKAFLDLLQNPKDHGVMLGKP